MLVRRDRAPAAARVRAAPSAGPGRARCMALPRARPSAPVKKGRRSPPSSGRPRTAGQPARPQTVRSCSVRRPGGRRPSRHEAGDCWNPSQPAPGAQASGCRRTPRKRSARRARRPAVRRSPPVVAGLVDEARILMPRTGNTQGIRLRIRPPTKASASVPARAAAAAGGGGHATAPPAQSGGDGRAKGAPIRKPVPPAESTPLGQGVAEPRRRRRAPT